MVGRVILQIIIKKKRLGGEKKQLEWLHETVSFHLSLNSRDTGIRRGVREGGGDLKGHESAGFTGLIYLFSSLPLSPSPFVGNKHISKDELYPSRWRTNPSHSGFCCVSAVAMYVCARLPFEILLTSKYLDWFSKGLSKTTPWIALLTSYFTRRWQIWRGGVVLIQAGEPIHNHHKHEERELLDGPSQFS